MVTFEEKAIPEKKLIEPTTSSPNSRKASLLGE
jgi:hypothetical protein